MIAESLVLVTGASGHLGGYCVQQLLQAGYKVRGTVLNLSNEREVKPINDLDRKGHLQLVQADLRTPDDWKRAVQGCQYVLHTASPGTDDAMTVTTAVEGVLNVLRAAAESTTVDRVVFTSSTSAICEARVNVLGKVFTEADWADATVKSTGWYPRSKIEAEKAAWEFVKGNAGRRFELAVINPGYLLGPPVHKNDYVTAGMLKQILQQRFPFVLDITMPCCNVRDVARAHLAAMTVPEAANHRHLVAEPRSYSILEMCNDLAPEFHPLGYKIPTMAIPYFLLWFISWLLSWFSKDALIIRQLGSEMKFDNTRMKRVLGIKLMRDRKKDLIDMAYALIDNGIVAKTPKYKPRSRR